jgi:hypothetical protein
MNNGKKNHQKLKQPGIAFRSLLPFSTNKIIRTWGTEELKPVKREGRRRRDKTQKTDDNRE